MNHKVSKTDECEDSYVLYHQLIVQTVYNFLSMYLIYTVFDETVIH